MLITTENILLLIFFLLGSALVAIIHIKFTSIYMLKHRCLFLRSSAYKGGVSIGPEGEANGCSGLKPPASGVISRKH